MTTIYLIRHGQASFLKSDYDKLSELGIIQSKVLGEALKDRNASFSNSFLGNLRRHEETAAHCLYALGQTLKPEVDKRWNEYDHMELLTLHNPTFTDFDALGEYVTRQENPMRALQLLLNDSIADWINEKHTYTLSWIDFKANVWKAINQIADGLSKDQHACVFTSGGPIAAVLIQLLSLQDRQFVDLQGRLMNSSVTKVLVGKGGLSLSTYNDYSHLEHDKNLMTYR